MNIRGQDRLKHLVKQTPLWPWINPRRVQAYCVGAPKTGTHSIAGLFADEFRSAHEPAFLENVRYIKKRRKGIADRELRNFLRKRDRRLWLEMESSHLIAHFVDTLVNLFPDSKYILPVRQPRSWLNSLMNQHLRVDLQPGSLPEQLRDIYHEVEKDHAKGEKVLADYNLYTLDGYLEYWEMHNRMVLDAIPDNRLLILRTKEISNSVRDIAYFLDVSSEKLNKENSNRYEAKEKKPLLSKVDKHIIEEKIDKYCTDVLNIIEEKID